jgi:hypothetical protein
MPQVKDIQKPASSTRLSPEELSEIAGKLAVAKDPKEIARLRKAFEKGFYGDPEEHA